MAWATRQLHPALIPYADYAIAWANYYGLTPEVTSVLRDWRTQAELRKQYERCLSREAPVWPGNPDPQCRYPANRPGDSAHEYGLAWDSWVAADSMPTWVAIRRAVGWTVPDNDPVHAELTGWRNYLQ